MKLTEPEMRMAYQLESTSQAGVLNELYMTCRYSRDEDTKATAESLMAKIRPLSDKECIYNHIGTFDHSKVTLWKGKAV